MSKLRVIPEPDALAPFLDRSFAVAGRPAELFVLLRAPALTRLALDRAVGAAGGRLDYFGKADRLFIGEGDLHWTHAAIARFDARAPLASASERGDLIDADAVHVLPFRRAMPPAALQGALAPLRLVGKLVDTGEAGLEGFARESGGEGGVLPTREQIVRCARDARESPAMFVNFLKYRDEARYDDGRSAPRTGRAAYQRYGVAAMAAVRAMGGRIAHAGRTSAPLLSLGDVRANDPALGDWDEIAIAAYPTPRTVLKLPRVPGYAKAGRHRSAGLERTTLIVTTEV